MSDSSNKSGGMSCGTLLAILLTVLFVGLKLTGYITWSWIWVLSPLWISIGLGLATLVIVLAIVAIGALAAGGISLASFKKNKYKKW